MRWVRSSGNKTMTDKPKRRWYQYSLRTLFVLMTLFAVACSWYAVEMQKAARRQMAMARIEKVAGKVEWRSSTTLTDRCFGSNPICAIFDGTQVTDAELMHLKGLIKLEGLYLDRTQITDAGMVHLEGLQKLQWLSLDSTQITDAGLVHLKGLTKLESLDLQDTQLTGAGLVHLKDLMKLGNLFLNGTQITDAGLVHLKGLTNLEDLYLDNAQVTEEGFKNLHQALPKCEIMH